jgi:hypothetical protein
MPGRSARRKAVRVGTALTGAAACAAAFAPGAAAATQGTAVRDVRPAISEKDCPDPQGNYFHWVHFYWQAASRHGPTCIGDKGTKVVDHIFQAFCGGNNYGWFTYISTGGTSYKSNIVSSPNDFIVSYSPPIFVKSVHISRWGNDGGCAY